MSSGRMVRVTRIDTGETWPSIAAAAKALFITPTSLSRAKVSGRTHVCDIPLKFEDTMTSVNATEMKDLETGIVYPTIVSVADAFGISTEFLDISWLGFVPAVARIYKSPDKEQLDDIYDHYCKYVGGRKVEGFVINVNNMIFKYVRMKNGKVVEYSQTGRKHDN